MNLYVRVGTLLERQLLNCLKAFFTEFTHPISVPRATRSQPNTQLGWIGLSNGLFDASQDIF